MSLTAKILGLAFIFNLLFGTVMLSNQGGEGDITSKLFDLQTWNWDRLDKWIEDDNKLLSYGGILIESTVNLGWFFVQLVGMVMGFLIAPVQVMVSPDSSGVERLGTQVLSGVTILINMLLMLRIYQIKNNKATD